LGGGAGFGASSPAELEAMAAGQRAYQQAAFKGQMADLERHRAAVSAAAAAYGVSLRSGDGRSSSDNAAAGAAQSPASSRDTVLEQITQMRKDLSSLRAEVEDLYKLGGIHHKALTEKGLLPKKTAPE
jgi:hypothetical protein